MIVSLLFACVEQPDTSHYSYPQSFQNESLQCGDVVATHNNVNVYSNGMGINSCAEGRHMSEDNYSYGLRWQCVEFVRRYYKDHLNHKMPVRWGHAKDYFAEDIGHGKRNPDRDLLQYRNGRSEKPKADDLLVCPNMALGYGHVAIIKAVGGDYVELIQQNTRYAIEKKKLYQTNGNWTIEGGCAGFLRKEG
ncbi:MAG: CHAP domain-containing protein [Myxococcota bacterium]|nr:CHAP domain-containing protein [Myxococcota bacterium]